VGLTQESEVHPESFSAGGDGQQWPPEIDWALVRLLYQPSLRAGMGTEEAMGVAAAILEEQNMDKTMLRPVEL
jgi:hypothetical protein